MAVFNPDVPQGRDGMPNYFRYSEPVSDIQADKSKGIALAGAGTAIEGAAELAKTTAHDIINKDVRETVEPIRDDFTKQLEAVRAAQNNIVPNAVQTTSGNSVGGTAASFAQAPTPPAIDSGLSKVQSIQDAFTNGKINDTYYDQRLKTGVTELRSRYPGFVDYIDQKVSSITGVNPANAYITNLMQDINHAVSSKKTEADKVLDIARTKGINYDKGYQMYQGLKNGTVSEDKYMEWYGEENVKDTQRERALGDLNLKAKAGQDVEGEAKKVLSDHISSRISSDFNGMISINGLNSPVAILDFMRQAEENPGKFTGPQYEEFAAKMIAHQNTLRTQLALETNRNGLTNKVGGSAARDAELDSQMKIYDFLKGVKDANGFGVAMFHVNQAKAVSQQRKDNFTMSSIGEVADKAEILNQKFGPGFAPLIAQTIMGEQTKLPDQLKALFHEKAVEAHAQPGGDTKPTTIAQHMREVDADKRIDGQSKAYIYKGLVNTSNEIKDPKMSDDVKATAVRYLFDPANNGVLQNWKMDYRTTSPDGRLKIEHPGKYAVWTQLTDKDVSDSISKLDDKSKSYYKNWVDITGRELIGEDVRNLNHFTGHDNLYFKWVNTGNGTPKLELQDNEGGLASPVGKKAGIPGDNYSTPNTTGYRVQVQAVVDRINRALPNLEHVYKSFGGGDTETMLLQTLGQYGMNFEGKISGLPKAFGDAIAASRKAPVKEPEKK